MEKCRGKEVNFQSNFELKYFERAKKKRKDNGNHNKAHGNIMRAVEISALMVFIEFGIRPLPEGGPFLVLYMFFFSFSFSFSFRPEKSACKVSLTCGNSLCYF